MHLKNYHQANLAPWQWVALNNPYDHFAMLCGISVGKTFTLAHFVIKMIVTYPTLTGLVAANSYDQLSQATLREVLYWLDHYGFEYVIDEIPPAEWGFTKKKFKSYRNILSVRVGPHIATIFTRVLADGDALRGIEFSWYALDETRDTPQNTHDIILSRLRESHIIKGLICTTTNGQDWCYERFVKNNRKGDRTYGSMHVSTREAVKEGIITQQFLDALLKSYSPQMVMQEIDALHVNVHTGRAYYAGTETNKRYRAPWGLEYPDPDRPLILGCDFNFSPSPCVWEVMQMSPDGECVHIFDEFSELEIGTKEMIRKVAFKYRDYFLQIFGDASGTKGTTSNMGKTDYDQMSEELMEMGIEHTIDVNPSNPLVKDRVENVNRLLCDGTGKHRLTYNPQTAPLFDADVQLVGWKFREGIGKAKLTGNGKTELTHATDGAGYALHKLFPPIRKMSIISSIQSEHASLRNAF